MYARHGVGGALAFWLARDRLVPLCFVASCAALRCCMDDVCPRLSPQPLSASAPVVLLGQWTVARLATPGVLDAVQRVLNSANEAGVAGWDLRQLQRLDHAGAQVLWNAWGRQWPPDLAALPDQRDMLGRVAKFSVPLPAVPAFSAWRTFLGLGEFLLRLADHLKDLIRLMGQLLLDLLRLVRSPRSGPWRDLSGHIFRIGAKALPITALVGFLIGVVLAYLISQQLRQYGADAFIVNVLGLSLIRELGPVLAAILLAGRSGSAITAQIGVMRVTEELDAMRVMGIAPGYRLVMPRAMAMALAMPLVSVWTTLSALLGGMLATDWVLGISPDYFMTALPLAVQVSNLWLALGKSVVFGLLIAIVACHYGLRVKPNTESLGQGTTASVVTSITVVLVVNAIFAVVFKDVGI